MSVPEEKLVTPEGAETPEVPPQEPSAEVVTPETTVVVETSAGISGKKKQTVQERIDEITKARREEEREKVYWRKIALEKEQANFKTPAEPEPKPPTGPARPALEQFNTQTEYEDALFSWYEQKKSIQQAEMQQRTVEEEGLRKFNRAAEKLRAEYDDFDSVIETPVFSQPMRLAILHSENGPDLAYHLGRLENRDIADRIRSLPPERQFYELGKIESQLLLAKSTKKVSSAPTPITPVGMGGAGGEVDPSKMTVEEWMKWDKEQTLKKLKERYGGG